MGKRRTITRNHRGLQAITLCISTALVLILLGLVVFTTLTGTNLSSYVKENLVVTLMLDQDISNQEALRINNDIEKRPYIKSISFISKEQALKEATVAMGSDPSEFTDGVNPFPSSVELTLTSKYANNDSLQWISAELQKYPDVADIVYQKDLVDSVNKNLAKIGIVLFVLAVLLTIVSFSLINNTVRLGIYAHRFSIHTMKLVGASWSFIRKPYVWHAVLMGIIAAIIAIALLGSALYALWRYEPDIMNVVTWQVMVITSLSILLFGVIITGFCACVSVNKFLKMKAGDLYKV